MRLSRLLIRAAAIAIASMALAVPGWLAGSAAATPTPTPTPAPTQPASPLSAPATGTPAPAAPSTPASAPPPGPEQPAPDEERGLPVTGAQVGGMVVLGGGLIAAGIAMVAVRPGGLSHLDFSG